MTSIATLQLELDQLAAKRADVVNRELEALTNSILPFFSEFTPEVDIEVTKSSVYFRMDHPEYSYKKELFSLYLRENWNFMGEEKCYTGIDLSYYTTSTKGVDAWELKRLQMLGKVAEIVHDHHDRILDRVNNDSLRFKDEFREVYKNIQEIQSAIGELKVIENEKVKSELKKALVSGNVVKFEKNVDIQFKFNYTARISDVKIINVSKSGKTADAIYTYAGEHKGRAENINVDKIVDHIFHIQKYTTS